MSRNTKRSSYIESGKWDEKTIDRVYEEQLDRIGEILDRVQTSGLRSALAADGFLGVVLRLFEMIENELLLQWQTKREGGLNGLFDRQKQWLNRELRHHDGVIATWNDYCNQALQKISMPDGLLVPHPWRSAVLGMMMNPGSYPGGCGGRYSTGRIRLLRSCCAVFRELYTICPHHQVVSFLNLIELGTGYRPEICEPGESSAALPDAGILPGRDAVLAGLDKPESWAEMPDRLTDFWDKDGCDGTA